MRRSKIRKTAEFGRADIVEGLILSAKITAAAVIAVSLASLIGLEFPVSAGIVAILSVAPTKRETVKTAAGRFAAFVLALCIAAVCFFIGGVGYGSFFAYLLIFIPCCRFMGWTSAMAMDSVLISHFLSFGVMDLYGVCNEVMLFAIGVSLGIAVNLHLGRSGRIDELKDDMDGQIRHILKRTAERVTDTSLENYDGHCFERLWECVYEAERLAHRNYLNVFHDDESDKKYIGMRREQIVRLTQMYEHCVRVRTSPQTGEAIAGFISRVAEEYAPENDVTGLLVNLRKLKEDMKTYSLPADRDEFEDRAELYALLQSLEDFLNIKKVFFQHVSGDIMD